MKSLALVILAVGCGEVIEEPPPPGAITVAITQPKAFVRQSSQLDLDVTITRNMFDADVSITASNLPAGVALTTVEIPAGETTGTLHLTADATATQGIANPIFTGTSADDPALTGDSDPFHLLVGGTPGSLDTSFANGGMFTPSLGGLAMDGRGGILTANGFVVTGAVVSNPAQAITVRVLEDGSLDAGFGSGGFVSTGVTGIAEGIAVVETSDGGVIAAGIAGGDFSGSNVECNFGLIKYTSAGSLDTSFGASGVAAIDPGSGCAEWHSVAIATDGSIIATGTFFANGTSPSGRAARYSASGVQDATFVINEPNVNIEGSLIQSDGKLVMVGSLSSDFWVARYNANGTRDAGFGTNGIVQTDFSAASDDAHGVVALPGNKLLVIGTTTVGTVPNTVSTISIARYNANGSLDVTFGTSGKVATTTVFESRGSAVAVDGTDVYFVGRRASDKAPAVARIRGDGTIDTNFGTNGVSAINFGVVGTTSNTGGFGVAVDADRRILVVGEQGPGGGQVMAIARLWF